MEDKIKEAIKSTSDKAKAANDSNNAMKFAQAVLSLTHALIELKEV